MANFIHTAIAELAHQLTLSPTRLRLQQLEATEQLIDHISPDKSYPYDFVCHHITGYRPRETGPSKTMPGKALIEDLASLNEQLSGSHPVAVDQMPVACWTTEELAERLHVSTKTICRWRRRGLAGRKLRYPDGTVRMAFTDRVIRRFVSHHGDRVRRGAAFSQLSAEEKKHIVHLAREELMQRRMKLHELSQVVAAKVGRAVETVRYTLRRWDKAHPDKALFAGGSFLAIPPELRAIDAAVAAGQSVRKVARRFGRSTEAVRSILLEVRAHRLTSRELSFVYNPEFEAPGAEQAILAPPPENDSDANGRVRPPKDLPPYLQELYRCPLLSAERERHLFRQYNFLKFKADRMRKAIDPQEVAEAALDEIDAVLAQSGAVKNQILKANLRLVVSITRRHVGYTSDFFEAVSDGNMALMRAVEKFDYARGFKFSTYASWAIMRTYARTIPEQRYTAVRLVTGVDEVLSAAPMHDETAERESVVEAARHLLSKGLSLLTARERDIVVCHYGLEKSSTPMTLEQIGQRLGVTKERIRQIERQAIQKLRQNLNPEDAHTP